MWHSRWVSVNFGVVPGWERTNYLDPILQQEYFWKFMNSYSTIRHAS